MSIFHRHRHSDEPFPEEWLAMIEDVFVPWPTLSDDEQQRLLGLTRELIDRKRWEGAKDFEVTDLMRVTIAVHAAMLILELDHRYYKGVHSIIVHPTTVVLRGERGAPSGGGLVTDAPMPIIGQASHNGPVIIVWDAATSQARHPERGHNVIYHEFAHKLDMLDGSVDGTPPLGSKEDRQRWIEVCTKEYHDLERGKGGHLLRDYASVNPGEFFAVATEVFFDKPKQMHRHKPDLYEVLQSFYLQDPATRSGP